MSSDFINGDRSPIPPDKLPLSTGVSLSDKSPRIQGSSDPRLVQAGSVLDERRDLISQISKPSLLLGSSSRGESIINNNGRNGPQSQGNQICQSDLAKQLQSSSRNDNQRLGIHNQNLGVSTNSSSYNLRGNQQWKPRNDGVYVNPISGISNINPDLVSVNLGNYINSGFSSQIEGNTSEGSQAGRLNIEVNFPPLARGIIQNHVEAGQGVCDQNKATQDERRQAETSQELSSPSWLNVMLRSDQRRKTEWGKALNIDKNRCALERRSLNKFNDNFLMPEEVVQNGSKLWKEVVVGFFFDSSFGFNFVEGHLRKRWRLKMKGRLTINFDKEMFFLRFSNVEDRKMVLDEGPFFINGKVFVLREWNASIEVEKRGCKSLPIWARFWDLPKFLWNKEGFSYLASAVGNPLFTDSITMDMKRMGYARICIEIDSKFDFPSKLKFMSGSLEFEVEVEYQWVPPICKNCNSFGHHFHSCKEPKKSDEKTDIHLDNNVEKLVSDSMQGKDMGDKIIMVEEENTQGKAAGEVDENIVNIEVDGNVSDGSSLQKESISTRTSDRINEINNLNGAEAVVENNTIKESQDVLADKELQEHVETVEGRITMGNNSEHIQQNKDSNVEVAQVTKDTSTAEKQKKTIEGSGITRPGITSEEKQTSVEENLEVDRNENRGGGRRIMGRYEVVHTQKERENRGRTRSGVVLQTKNTYSPLNQKENEESSINFNGDIEEYDEDGSSQPDEDGIPFLNGVPNILKSYSASKEKGAKVKNQNSASKVKGTIANKHQKAMGTPVKESTNVRNIAIRGKGHNQRR